MEKEKLKYYWGLIDTPVTIFVLFSLVTLAVPIEKILGTAISSILSLLVMVFVFGFVGYNASKEKEHPYTKAGAYAGILLGFFSAVIGIVTFYFMPDRFAEAIQNAVSAGADASMVTLFIKISLFAGLVFYPAIYAGIGALISNLSRFVFKRKKNK